MSLIYVFADEAGNFDFSRKPGATLYFILSTITIPDCGVGDDLLALRRHLAWDGVDLRGEFHATEDTQAVRDRVFDVLSKRDFRVDATIFDKSKVQPHLRADEIRFYKTAWYLHFKHVAKLVARPDDGLLVVAASIGTKAKWSALKSAVHDVVTRVAPTTYFRTAFWPAACDPCLQVADYCCWAIQRRWERGDFRSRDLIGSKIATEHDIFAGDSAVYY
jgi:hypothetical protein